MFTNLIFWFYLTTSPASLVTGTNIYYTPELCETAKAEMAQSMPENVTFNAVCTLAYVPNPLV